MPNPFQVDSILDPVTALTFLKLGSRTLLLAGEGPLLRIYDQKKIQLLLSDRIFESRVIHGLCAEATTDHSDDRTHCGRILIWGGRSVCLLAIDINAVHEDQYDVQIRPIMREIQVDDWIFDACFSPIAYSGPVPESIARGCNAVLVTAHNDLLALNTQPDSNSGIGAIPSFKCIAAGPQSILYSAHVTWPRNGRGLVAAGTVFGEVLLWSFSPDQFFLDSELVIPGHLHYRFTGHEGSIFGVQMSEEFVISGVGLPRRILASCSDDRTIKIWDISNLELDRDGNEAQSLSSKPNIEHSGDNSKSKENSCLAEVMGHNSRIWGVRFLFQQTNSWRLISYGEDATAQIWQLRFNSSDSVSSEKFTSHATILFHQSSYAYHSGKNIWSLATYTETTCESMIYTGGADGRIVSYTVKSEDFPWANNSQSSQWSIEEAYLGANTNTAHAQGILSVESTSKQPSPSQKVLFQSLQGKWLLHRDLNSAITTYPSGSFKGTAVFEARKPTDEAYDLEYLYVESGKYTAAQGFSMEATRRYAYRFQQRTNTITVWFISTEDQSTIDYLFHVLNFESPSKDLETKNHYGVITLRATGDHLCIDDNYQASYQFQIGTAALTSWDLKYNVKGPNKDYVANANYVRGGDMEQPAAIIETVNPKSQSVEASNNPTGLAEKKPDPDSFKNYAWLDQDCLITSTEKGTILLGNLPRKAESYKVGRTMFDSSIESWTFFGQVNELKSYCTITSTRSCQMAVLGGSEGDLYLYRYPGQLLHLTKLPRKIAFLPAHMLPLGSVFLTEEQGQVSSVVAIFASCLGYSTAHLLIIGAGESGQNDTQNLSSSSANIEVLQNVRIDLPPHFVATSALMIESQGLLILGSRSGRLSIYDLLADADDCGTCIFLSENIHGNGEDLITMIQSVPDAISGSHSKDFYILTTGRDGNYSVQQMFVERIENGKPRTSLRIVHRCAPPFSPNVEGARFLEETNDLLLWGFRSKRFVVWNETQKTELMNVDCGGANRNWAYTPQSDASGGGRFVWTKASICNIHSQRQASHQVLQHGGHGREIKAMAIFPQIIGGNSFSSKIIATGAEDTAIRIFSYEYECTKRKAQGFKCLGIFTNHKAGVQQLKWSSDGKYLFSAAGFEEFFIWRVRSVPCIGVGVVCEARFPPVTEPSDLRIMDFDILEIGSEKGDEYILSLVCSDSSLRIYHYNSHQPHQPLAPFLSTSYTTACLTQITHISLGPSIHLCTASTDGHVAFWHLTPILAAYGLSISSDNSDKLSYNTLSGTVAAPTLKYHAHIPLHQNSIKALIAITLSPTATDVLLTTAGDDGTLAFTRVSSPSAPTTDYIQHATLLIPNAHASAITAVACLGLVTKLNPVAHEEPPHGKKRLRYATSSNDQNFKTWAVSIDLEKEGVKGVEVRKQWSGKSSVADVAAMGTYGDRVVLAGIGMEVWGVGGSDLKVGVRERRKEDKI